MVEHTGVRGTHFRRSSWMIVTHALKDGRVARLPRPIVQTEVRTHRLSAERLPAVSACQCCSRPMTAAPTPAPMCIKVAGFAVARKMLPANKEEETAEPTPRSGKHADPSMPPD